VAWVNREWGTFKWHNDVQWIPDLSWNVNLDQEYKFALLSNFFFQHRNLMISMKLFKYLSFRLHHVTRPGMFQTKLTKNSLRKAKIISHDNIFTKPAVWIAVNASLQKMIYKMYWRRIKVN
jgi:hypothetical protein